MATLFEMDGTTTDFLVDYPRNNPTMLGKLFELTSNGIGLHVKPTYNFYKIYKIDGVAPIDRPMTIEVEFKVLKQSSIVTNTSSVFHFGVGFVEDGTDRVKYCGASASSTSGIYYKISRMGENYNNYGNLLIDSLAISTRVDANKVRDGWNNIKFSFDRYRGTTYHNKLNSYYGAIDMNVDHINKFYKKVGLDYDPGNLQIMGPIVPVLVFMESAIEIRKLKVTDEFIDNPLDWIEGKGVAVNLYSTLKSDEGSFYQKQSKSVYYETAEIKNHQKTDIVSTGNDSFSSSVYYTKAGVVSGEKIKVYHNGKFYIDIELKSDGSFGIDGISLKETQFVYMGENLMKTNWYGDGHLAGQYQIKGVDTPNAVVKLYMDSNNQYIGQTVTNHHGKFTFPFLNKNETFTVIAQDPKGEWEHRVSSKRNPV